MLGDDNTGPVSFGGSVLYIPATCNDITDGLRQLNNRTLLVIL